MEFHIHIITNGDENRIKKTIQSLEYYNFPYTFHTFEKHPTSGKKGCFLSHIEMYKYARDNNLEYICIAEDNIIETKVNLKRIKTELIDILQKKWNIIILGGWFVPFTVCKSTSYKYIYNTTSLHGTSCYIIHKKFYSYILKHYKKYQEYHIDYYLMQEAKLKAFIVNPFLFRRNNIIPTTNTYLINSVVDMYHYINCSNIMTKGWQYFSKHSVFLVLCLVIIILLIIILILFIKYDR